MKPVASTLDAASKTLEGVKVSMFDKDHDISNIRNRHPRVFYNSE